jgi:hypothetical protein
VPASKLAVPSVSEATIRAIQLRGTAKGLPVAPYGLLLMALSVVLRIRRDVSGEALYTAAATILADFDGRADAETHHEC